MTVIRKDPILRKQSKTQVFARGDRSIAIDQRSGFKHLQDDMVFEPGTNYYVYKEESDKGNNLVTDPLNFPSDKIRTGESIGLKYPSPDVKLSVGLVVSAVSLGVDGDIIGPNANFYNYPGETLGP